ncbi:MAG: MFS transporter [Deltaproteobacteria bacterium]|nr:MFS transporter [Deltaproteobacteria bacterium]
MALRLPPTFAALRHRNYRLFFAGQLVSLVGTWMQSVAQGWLVYQLTGSALALGLVSAAGQAPVLVLALLGGAVADRVAKRPLLLFTQSALGCFALLLGALTALDLVRPWHVALIAALSGVANAFDLPTRQAFVTEMVGEDDLLNAIALNSAIFHGARIIGPTVAGLMVASVGLSACFLVNGASFLAVIAALVAMRLPPRARPPADGSLWRNLVAGVRYAARTPHVAAILLLVATFGVFGLPYAVLLPVYARDILGVGPQGLGMLFAASGTGALAGSLALATFSRTRRRALLLLVGLGAFAVAIGGFGWSQRFGLALGFLVVSGASAITFMASCNTLLQTTVPEELRGRMMGMYSFVFLGLAPFGALQAGSVAHAFGAPVAILVGAVVCVVAVVLVVGFVPTLRRPQDELAAASAGAAAPASAGLAAPTRPTATPLPIEPGPQG